MSVVLAAYDSTMVAMGADSGAFEDEMLVTVTTTPKIWRVGEYLVGGTGSFRALEHARQLNIGEPRQLRSALAETAIGSDWGILVASRKGVWEIAGDLSLVSFADRYGAIGAGGAIGTGALAALDKGQHTAQECVKVALNAVLSIHH
jgi:hypothetical protein